MTRSATPIADAIAHDRPDGLPASTMRWEAWWALACNARFREDQTALRCALAQYQRAVMLEWGDD